MYSLALVGILGLALRAIPAAADEIKYVKWIDEKDTNHQNCAINIIDLAGCTGWTTSVHSNCNGGGGWSAEDNDVDCSTCAFQEPADQRDGIKKEICNSAHVTMFQNGTFVFENSAEPPEPDTFSCRTPYQDGVGWVYDGASCRAGDPEPEPEPEPEPVEPVLSTLTSICTGCAASTPMPNATWTSL